MISGRYRLTIELSPYFSSGYYTVFSDESMFYQERYMRLDSRASLRTQDGRWSLEVIGKNLTNRDIQTTWGGPVYAAKQMPRNFAVQLRYQW
jgi:outer membrane receptor protein involved in Fe transport